jgi:photosystem II stability/assembly factor-like uncharacterized protein
MVACFLLAFAAPVLAGSGETPQEFNWKKAYFFNFYGVCPLDSGAVYIVGSKGIICAYDRISGKWTIQESGFSRNLYDVHFPDQDHGWITGQNGKILHTEDKGANWTTQNSGTTEHLFGVSFPDSEHGWAVGSYGTILHTVDGGKTWEPQGDQIDRIYNDVSFPDAKNGWIVGEFGVIIRTSDGGKTWVEQENPYGEKTLFSVFFKDSQNGYASGMDGAILQTVDGGNTWTQIESNTKENLFSVTARGDREWAVGLKGTFTTQDNGAWLPASEKIPTRAWLKQCAFTDSQKGWIVGSVGTVLRTVDGGSTWQQAWMITN